MQRRARKKAGRFWAGTRQDMTAKKKAVNKSRWRLKKRQHARARTHTQSSEETRSHKKEVTKKVECCSTERVEREREREQEMVRTKKEVNEKSTVLQQSERESRACSEKIEDTRRRRRGCHCLQE